MKSSDVQNIYGLAGVVDSFFFFYYFYSNG